MKKKINPTLLVLGGLILGLIVGLVFGEKAAVLQPIGDLFLRLIKMLVIPLVMCSIINSVSNMEDINVMGRVGGKTLALYVITTAIAAVIAIAVGMAFHVGQGVNIIEAVEPTDVEAPTVLGILLNCVPTNIFEAMANFDTLPCIVFSILFGIALVLVGEPAAPVKKFFSSCTLVMYKLVGIVVKVAPIGVFALIASGIGQNGSEILSALGLFCILHYVCGAVVIVFFLILVKVGSPLKLGAYIKAASRVFMTAFSTRSSAATLPVTISTAINEVGIDEGIAQFTLPIGCTINMNGNAIAMALAAVLGSFVYGQPLTFNQIAIAIAIATVSSIGMPGVPNSGIVFNVFLFTALGFPAGALIGMIASVEALTDMLCTAINVTGDLTCAVVVANSEGKLNKVD